MENLLFAYAKTNQLQSNRAALILAPLFSLHIVQFIYMYFVNMKFQASSQLCGCTACFLLDLIGNPKDRFSHDAAHMV